MKRVRRTNEQWQVILDQWQESELTPKAFCSQQGITYPSFQAARQRLAGAFGNRRAKAQPVPTFINLEEIPAEGRSSASGWNITLRLGNGIELELSQSA